MQSQKFDLITEEPAAVLAVLKFLQNSRLSSRPIAMVNISDTNISTKKLNKNASLALPIC